METLSMCENIGEIGGILHSFIYLPNIYWALTTCLMLGEAPGMSSEGHPEVHPEVPALGPLSKHRPGVRQPGQSPDFVLQWPQAPTLCP